ncbi:MAG: NAD-dependent epimerase/dehydratase family protein [Bacteroidia bacterium]|nr:NAD-dependent epimerase/dehydratase family protein [Bacteroidia bacterium]
MTFQDLSASVLVTGGKGLLGSEMTFGKQIDIYDVDLTEKKATIEYIADIKPEVVINCAGLVGGLIANMNRKADFFSQNMYIALNTLEACRLAGVKRVISLLSTCIFPDDLAQNKELTEEDVHNGIPHSSNYGYAYAKRMIDIINRTYYEQYGIRYEEIIPTNMYGPDDNYNLEHAHIIPALIKKAFISSANNDNFIIWGDGSPVREFIYAKDLARFVYHIITKEIFIPPLIFSSSVRHTIKEIACMIAELSGIPDNRIVFDTSKPNGQHQKNTSNRLFRSLFPDFEFTTLKQGLSETIKYFHENYNSLRH